MDLIDLRDRTTRATVLLAVARGLGIVVVFGCLVAVYRGSGSAAVRITMAVLAVLLVAGVGLVGWNRHRMVRFLAVDHDGLRLLDRRRRDVARFAWDDLAGVGLMTDENALARKRLGALASGSIAGRAMASVSIWLEVWPAGPDAVARQPRLRPAWELGRRQCWRIWLSDGLGQSFALGAAVLRHRPEVWRGQRAGSALFG